MPAGHGLLRQPLKSAAGSGARPSTSIPPATQLHPSPWQPSAQHGAANTVRPRYKDAASPALDLLVQPRFALRLHEANDYPLSRGACAFPQVDAASVIFVRAQHVGRAVAIGTTPRASCQLRSRYPPKISSFSRAQSARPQSSSFPSGLWRNSEAVTIGAAGSPRSALCHIELVLFRRGHCA
jgi:hypothetical protein